MAIIYVDHFETSLQAPISDTDNAIDIPEGAVAQLNAAFGWATPMMDPPMARVPLFLDDGTNWELVMCTCWPGSPTNISRPGTPHAFAAGTTVRCAPAALMHAAHATTRDIASDTAYAIAGEEMVWTPATTGDLTLHLPHLDAWSKGVPVHTGDQWPGRVVIANGNVARTLYLMDWAGVYPASVWIAGVSGGVLDLALPATAEVSVLTIRKIPLPIRSDTMSVAFTLAVEHFG